MLKLVKRSKSPYWVIRGTIEGRRIERSTQTSSKAEAKRILETFWRTATADQIGIKGLTFEQAAAIYLDCRSAPLKLQEILAHFGETPVSEINNQAVRICANRLLPDAKPATIRRHIFTPIQAIINNAADEDLCARVKFKKPAGDSVRTHFFTPGQADKLISACSMPPAPNHTVNPHMAALVTFLIGQGVRASEAFKLQWQDVSLSHRYAMIRDTKNGEERSITLIPRVIAALSTIQGEGNVFRRRDGSPFTVREAGGGGQVSRDFRSALTKAEINPQDYKLHSCRHTWATWFYAQTRDVVRLANEGGWKSGLWQRYTKLGNPLLGDSVREHGWHFEGEKRGTENWELMKSNG